MGHESAPFYIYIYKIQINIMVTKQGLEKQIISFKNFFESENPFLIAETLDEYKKEYSNNLKSLLKKVLESPIQKLLPPSYSVGLLQRGIKIYKSNENPKFSPNIEILQILFQSSPFNLSEDLLISLTPINCPNKWELEKLVVIGNISKYILKNQQKITSSYNNQLSKIVDKHTKNLNKIDKRSDNYFSKQINLTSNIYKYFYNTLTKEGKYDFLYNITILHNNKFYSDISSISYSFFEEKHKITFLKSDGIKISFDFTYDKLTNFLETNFKENLGNNKSLFEN